MNPAYLKGREEKFWQSRVDKVRCIFAFPFYFLKRLIDHDLYLTTRMLIEMVCILIHPNRVSVHEKQIKTTSLQNLVHNLVLLKTRLKQNLNP